MMRINRFMAQSGVAARRKCDDLISAGKVKVNGQVIDIPEIAQQCTYRDVNHIVTKAPAVRPSPGNGATTESILDTTGEDISAEYAEAMKTIIVTVAGQACRSCREVNLD